MSLLAATGLVAGFGTHTVLHGVDLSVEAGEVSGIFGLNGAGKSVTLKTLAGLIAPWDGRIEFRGQDVTKASPEDRVELGMGHVPQGRNVFPELTVEENLRLGAYVLRKRDRSRYRAAADAVYDRFPLLADRRAQLAGTLSGGEQAALAVGRALVNEPELILVDEPSAGLAPAIVQELLSTLRDVASSGVTMVLVEQNVAFGLEVVDRAHILQTGRVVYDGAVATLDRDRLATLLGIGRMLGARTDRALASRRSRAKREPTAKAQGAKKKATSKKSAAKKKTTAKRKGGQR